MKTITELQQRLSAVENFIRLGSLAPVYVVENVTGLSRSRVDFLVLTGVFQSRRQFGTFLIEMDSVRDWYSRRVVKESSKSAVDILRDSRSPSLKAKKLPSGIRAKVRCSS